MPPFDEKHEFFALNTDLVDRKLSPSMYRYLLNGVTGASEVDNVGAVENLKGNTSLENILPSGTNVCIGQTLNQEENTTIFLNYNSDNNHGIYEYDPDTETFTTILVWSGLNFQSGRTIILGGSPPVFIFTHQKITGIDVINGQLIFADVNNEIRKITIQRAKDGEYTAAGPTEEDITFIRRPPKYPIEVSTLEDTNYTRNYIEKDAFQFTYRYWYLDNERSVFAPLSKTIVLSKETAADTNAISLKIPALEIVPNFVKKVEWVFRTNSTNEYALFNIADPANRILTFHNDVAGITMADADILKPFDDVPLNARGLRVSENRIVLNDYLHGYDAPEITMSAVAVGGDPTHLISGQTLEESLQTTTSYNPGPGGPAASCVATTSSLIRMAYWYTNGAGKYFKVDYEARTPGPNRAYIQSGQGDGLTGLQIQATEIFPSLSQSCRDKGNFDIVQIYAPTITNPGIVADVYLSNPQNQQIFKFEDTYQLGIKFTDFAGRNVGVVTSPTARVTIPAATDPKNPAVLYHEIQWNLTGPASEIPLWATEVEIVRTKNLSRSSFIQGTAGDLVYGKREESSTTGDTVTGGELKLSKSASQGTQLYLYIANSAKYKIGYTFSEGDRCRIYLAATTEWFDLAIKGQDGNWLVLEHQDIGTFLGPPTDTRYEIYTPAQGQIDELYYEIGEKFPIGNPGLSNRDYSQREGFIRGDVYWKARDNYLIDSNSYIIQPAFSREMELQDEPVPEDFEAMNPNDQYYERWVNDVGRSTTLLPEARQIQKRYTLKYGGEFTPDSFINNTSSFNAQDEYPMPYENGPAVSLEKSNNVVLYFHERETTSIYMKEGFLSTIGGKDSLIRVLNVIGDDRKLRRGHGTINPESIVAYEDDVWFWDMYKGTVVRYTNEGLVPVSDYGMKNYFYRLSRLLLPYKDEAKVYGVYDPFLDYYILTFAPVVSLNYAGETIAYNKTEGSWVGWYSFAPEMYTQINNRLFSFKDGVMWKHGSNDLHNNFYGVQYKRNIRFACGQKHGSKVKVWGNYSIDAESITIDLDGSNIPIKVTNSAGQEARVYAHQMETREGVFNGTLRQDVNTPNDANLPFETPLERENHMMYNGDNVRSQMCLVEIENDRTDLSPMFYVTLLYRLSEASVQ